MPTRHHLLTDDDLAGVLAEVDSLREWVRDLTQQRNEHLTTIRDLRRELAQRPVPATVLDPPDVIPQ